MAAAARALIVSRVGGLSLNPLHPTKPPPPCPLFLPSLPTAVKSDRFSTSVVSCIISGVDGGGVSDDFVSVRKSSFDRGFAVISNMLKRIEPLDTSVISKGVSDSAKDSMKQTISSMLGLLPSDQFSVTVNVSRRPLDRLLTSSIITGYTLWNAEYRISLMRNFDIPSYSSERSNCLKQMEVSEEKESEVRNKEDGFNVDLEEYERIGPQLFKDLSPEALDYIQQLQSELSKVKEELKAQEQEAVQIEYDRGIRNNLLEYLRSLDPDMVTELSQPSSVEIEDIIRQLVKNIMQRFFKDDAVSGFKEDTIEAFRDIHTEKDEEFHDTIGTSRDYLAKLLFWCMLMGHHLRGLENRLHLSCVVGLL